MITKGFLNFIIKFYSHNQAATIEFKEWKGRLKKVKEEKELAALLKEVQSNETPETLLDLYEEITKEKEEVRKKQGETLVDQNLIDLRQQVLMQLTLKHRDVATELIVTEFKKNNSIYTTKDDIKPEMWIYKEGIYVPEGRTFVKEFSRKILGDAYTTTLANAIIAKIEADTGIEADDFFKQEHLEEMPVLNGILNVFTKELKEFSPKKIFFNKLQVSYDPEATCPKIDKFLSDVLAKPDDKKVFYELAGFGLLKEYRLEKAIMFVGDGRNGKSKTIELLKRLFGIENCCSIPLASLVPSSFSIAELFGKLFNLAGDLSSSDLKDTGMFKSLTGRDIISAQRKFLRDLVFTNYAKMIFACNDLPRVYDHSQGFWERWVLLEFPYRFVDQETYDNGTEEEKKSWKIRDTEIIEKISTPEELSGLLNKAIDGLHLILKNNKFSYSVGTKEIKDKWIRKSDSFMAFCLDNLEESYDSKVSKRKIRKLFAKYCKIHRLRGSSDKSIKITLQNNYGVTDEYSSEFGVGGQEWCWVGIKIKNEI